MVDELVCPCGWVDVGAFNNMLHENLVSDLLDH